MLAGLMLIKQQKQPGPGGGRGRPFAKAGPATPPAGRIAEATAMAIATTDFNRRLQHIENAHRTDNPVNFYR